MKLKEILEQLESLKNPKNVLGMARFGIRPKTQVYGIATPKLRNMAGKIGKNNALALELWESKIHEARLLAGFIGEPEKVTAKQFKKWASDFDSWDICDQVCSNLFDKTKFADYKNILKLSVAKPEFTKRTAFVLMACLAVHDKNMKDADFIKFFPLIKKQSTDDRNFVKKAINWALRQIGKRNIALREKSLVIAEQILSLDLKSFHWIAKNAILELSSLKLKKD